MELVVAGGGGAGASDAAAADRAALERHLGTCAECRKLVAALVSETAEGPRAGAGGATLETVADSPLGRTRAPTSVDAGRLPDKIGRYLPARFLGAGGMGVVYAAFDPQLRRDVALKVIRPERIHGGVGTERDRLLREAQAMAKLAHPNVVSIHDAGLDGEQVFVAMELVAGTTLREVVGDPSVARDRRLGLMLDTGRGLAAAHAVGIVHRDFKPENVLLGADGRPRVTDFGLARAIGDDDAVSAEEPRGPTTGEARSPGEGPWPHDQQTWPDMVNETITRTGFFAGTPGYMAPEQYDGAAVDARTDQFAFAVVVWEVLCGERPFAGRFAEEIVANIRAGAVRTPDPEAIPPRLAAVLERALAGAHDARYPTMDALIAAITEAERRTTVEAPMVVAAAPRSRAPWVLGALVIASAAAVFFLLRDPGRGAGAVTTPVPVPVPVLSASSPDAAPSPVAPVAAAAPDAAPVANPAPVAAKPTSKKRAKKSGKKSPRAVQGDALMENPWAKP